MAWYLSHLFCMYILNFLNLDHLKSKQHKRMVHKTDRAIFRRKLDNALPSLLNTLDVLQSKKMSEKEKESDDEIETNK
jgi:hypothetical protein